MLRLRPALQAFACFVACLAVDAAADPQPPRDWAVSLYTEGSALALTLKTTDDLTTSPSYDANNDVTGGFSIRYKQFGISTGSPWMGTSRLDAERPATRFFDLRLQWLGERWGFESYGQYFRGFYATSDVGDTVYLDNPGARLRSFNFNVYRAAGEGSRVWRMRDGLRNTGFAANAYLMAGVSRQSLQSPVPLLDTLGGGEGTPFERMHRFAYTGLNAGVGMTLNTNLWGVYFDPTLFVGGGVRLAESDVPVSRIGGMMKVHLKLQTGYEMDRLNVGLSVSNDFNVAGIEGDHDLGFHSIVARIFITTYF